MAKQQSKDDSARSERQDRAASVRHAAVQAVAAAAAGQAQFTRDRAQELADDLVSAAARVREALEDLRPPTGEDLRDVRGRLDALESRVAGLEQQAAPKTRKAPAKRKPAGGTAKGTRRPSAS